MAEAKGVTVRFPEGMLEQVKDEAERCSTTLSAWVLEAVRSKLGCAPALDAPKPGRRAEAAQPAASSDRQIAGHTWDGQPIYADEVKVRPKGVKK